MEIALNSVASSTHTITLIEAERVPVLLKNQIDNPASNKPYAIANRRVVGIGHNILNLFGSPMDSYRKEEVLTTNDKYALASLTLKNALNVNNDNANVSGSQKLIEQQTNKPKILQCNSSDLTMQQKQKKDAAKTPDDLLAALKGTKKSPTNKLSDSNQTTSSNASTSFSSSSSSSEPSVSASIATIATLTTTNSSNSSLTTDSSFMSCNTVSSTASSTKNGLRIPSDILDDLASRFIINVPDMELSNLIRICFQIELAHWFYLDFFCASPSDQQQVDDSGKKKKLPSCGIKQFAIQLFQHIPFLREHLKSIDKILDDWKNYKLSVPTFGAILISEDLNFCLLVQSYFAKSSWGFPKGKVNENEDPVHCATREVFEETGYDITKLIVPNDYIEAVINYQYTRLYIVRDVSLNTQFSPRTRNEIKCCDWFPIDSLPVNKNDAISKAKLGINANSFFMIMPFVKRLKKWVHDKRSGVDTRRKYSGDCEGSSPESTNSPSTLMTTAAMATIGVVVGGNNNNQKHTMTNSCKKNKHHSNSSNDEKHNALKTSGGNTPNTGNNNGVSILATSNNSNRSKRQRHKSMGDLDGIKLNNLSSSNCNSNNIGNNSANIMTVAVDNGESTKESNLNYDGDSGICKTVSSHKRNGNSIKLVAAGSSNNVQNSNQNSTAGCTTTKRQLFHSQSQNGNNQNGEKIVSSFDLIRKEKQQQMKAAAQADKVTKAQKQQQQVQSNAGYNNGRVRAKSQGDKMCVQQQYINKTQNTNTNNNGGNNKHRVQKQISMIIVNSNATTNNDKNSIHNNTINNNNTATVSARAASNYSPAVCSGAELLAFAAETAAASSMSSATNSAQKQRPASVSLHFATPPTPAAGQAIQQLQRMASGTNLRILKRSTSYQPQSQQLQSKSNSIQLLQQQQALFEQSKQLENDQKLRQAPLKFTPSFNSWTNFSFTKNFIANVFC